MGIGLLAGLALLGWFWNRSRAPSLLLITLDTTRADRLGCYHYPSALTPCLDRLAREGVVFEQAVTNVPLTLPSHSTMLTGKLPPEHGLHVNAMGSLPKSIRTLTEEFADRNYRTGAFLASFVLDHNFGLHKGFHHYDDDFSGGEAPSESAFGRRRKANAIVDRALNWFSETGSRLGLLRRPYFCWVHFYDAHHPCGEHRELFGDKFAGKAYDAEIAYVDQNIQRLLNELRSRGELDNTLIVVAGDHGEGLGDHAEESHGQQLYQSTLHVPLLFNWPGKIEKPARITEGVGLVDLTPTLLEAFQWPEFSRFSGRSLWPAASRGESFSSRALFAETFEPYFAFHAAPQQGVIFEGWKYIRSPVPELYHLAEDRGEMKNLAAAEPARLKEYASLLSNLEASFEVRASEEADVDPRMLDWLRSIGYSGGTQLPDKAATSDLPDVKTVLPGFNLVTAALEHRDHRGQVEEAEKLFQQAIDQYPQLILGKTFYAETLAQKADRLPRNDPAREQLFAKVITLCREVIAFEKKFPDGEKSWESHLILAGALSEIGQTSEAETQYKLTAEKLQPKNPKAHLSWGMALIRDGKRTEAKPHLERAVTLDEGQFTAQAELGETLLAQGNSDKALARFQLAVKHNPRAFPAQFRIVEIQKSRKNWTAAIAQLKTILQLAPGDPRATQLLAECEQRQAENR